MRASKILENREAYRDVFVIRNNYKKFFICRNFKFSTEAPKREPTLYFEDALRKRTGRLRQQHGGGPLAKIDHHRRIRLFLSEERFSSLEKRHTRNEKKLPTFCRDELEPSDGTHLIEFEWDGVSVKKWHKSEGIVSTSRTDVKHRIEQALENILGIPP